MRIMERMARFSRILLWKVLVSLSPGLSSWFSEQLGGTTGMCGGIGSVLLPSLFYSCGIDALPQPFGSGDTPRERQSAAFRWRFATHAAPQLAPSLATGGAVIPEEVQLLGYPAGVLAPREVPANRLAVAQRQQDELKPTVPGIRDITGFPSPPPTLDADLEDEKGDKGEEPTWGLNKLVDFDRGPPQTPESVAAQPPPLLPTPGQLCVKYWVPAMS